MHVKYFFITDELLKKEKKERLIEYTRDILNDCSIKKSEKKDIFYKFIIEKTHRLKQIDFQQFIDYFNWEINSTDIFQEVSFKDVLNSLDIIEKQIDYLKYRNSLKNKTQEEKFATRNMICHLYMIRDRALRNLVILKFGRIKCIYHYEKKNEIIFSTWINHKMHYFKVSKNEKIYQDWISNKKIPHKKYIVPELKQIKRGVNQIELNKAIAILKATGKVSKEHLTYKKDI